MSDDRNLYRERAEGGSSVKTRRENLGIEIQTLKGELQALRNIGIRRYENVGGITRKTRIGNKGNVREGKR